MQNSTKKFLAVLLSLVMVLSLPVVVFAEVNEPASYAETFKGTYTKPEAGVRDVLLSGSTADVSISEWYGDRFTVRDNSGTPVSYSVRQNEYGINMDGNMIDMTLNDTYTLWLAQYGVASLQFTAKEYGRYVFSTSRANYDYTDDMFGRFSVVAYSPVVDEETKEIKYHYVNNGYGYYENLRDKEYWAGSTNEQWYEDKDAAFSVVLDKDETIIVAAKGNEKYDYVYNFSVKEWTEENCTHEDYSWEEVYSSKFNRYYDRKICKLCGRDVTCEKRDHDYLPIEGLYEVETGSDIWAQDYECLRCGKKATDSQVHNYVFISDDGCNWQQKCEGCHKTGKTFQKKSLEWHNEGSVDISVSKNGCTTTTTYTCRECSMTWSKTKTKHKYEWSYDKEHCKETRYCSNCDEKNVWEDHYYDYEYVREENGCIIKVYEICNTCGKKFYSYTYENHAWALVQDRPQIGAENQCGTIHMECAKCGARDGSPRIVHCTWFDYKCNRCGYDPTHRPTGGGSGGGGALPEEEPVEETKPEVKPVVEEKAPTATSTKVDGVWVDTALAKTSVTSKSIKKTSFTVTFKEAKKADGYQVEYSTSKKFTKKTSKKATVKKASKKATKKTVKNVKNNKKYYVRVRSYKVVNGQKVYSKWSKVTTVKTKK